MSLEFKPGSCYTNTEFNGVVISRNILLVWSDPFATEDVDTLVKEDIWLFIEETEPGWLKVLTKKCLGFLHRNAMSEHTREVYGEI